MSKNNAIRFAAGNPEGPRSAVWRLWFSGNDVYVSARLYGNAIKGSLLKSGKWRWGFTKEYTAREDSLLSAGADRALHKWKRPPELYPGITSAFEIIVPSTELTIPRYPLAEEADRKYTSKVHWVSAPSSEIETHFRILFIAVDSSTTVTHKVIWQHELPSGEMASLIVYEQLTTEGNKALLASEKRRIQQEVGKPSEDSAIFKAQEPRGYLLGEAEDGTWFLVDISIDFLFER